VNKRHPEPLAEADEPRFYALVGVVHDALADTRGCYHPKFLPNQCALVASTLWQEGVRVEEKKR
jgi:hypothetical protein